MCAFLISYRKEETRFMLKNQVLGQNGGKGMSNILVTRSSMLSYEEYCEEIKELWDTHWLTNMGAKYMVPNGIPTAVP